MVGRVLAGALIVAVVGAATGAAVAWTTVGRGTPEFGEGPSSWHASAQLGTANTDPVSRAVIARTGIWALPSTEVLYYFADHDETGATLSRACVYEVAGKGDLPARWWSLGLYRNDRWVDNPLDRYAVSQTAVRRDASDAWRIRIAAAPQPGDWLPMGPADGRFVLTFRLYQPDPQLSKALKSAPLPPIRRLSCA